MNVGTKLKNFRRQNRFSVSYICKKLKEKNIFFTEAMVYKWEEDISEPNIYTLIELSKILNVPVSVFIKENCDSVNIYNLTDVELRLLNKFREDKNFSKLALQLSDYIKTHRL